MKMMTVLKMTLGAGLLAAQALSLSSCSSGKDGAGQVTTASIPSGMSPICPAADSSCCRGTSTIQDTSASCNSVFTPESNNQTAAAFAAHGASAGLDAGSKLASTSDVAGVGATAGTNPIDTATSGSSSGISPTSDASTSAFAAPSGPAVGSLASGSSNGSGSAGGGGGSAGLGGGSTTAPASANTLVGSAGTLPVSPGLVGGGGGGGSSRTGSGGTALGALAGMMGDLGGAGSAAGGKTNLNFGNSKADALTAQPALASSDPVDYFLRLNTTDNIFKVVERRYQQTVLGWSMPATVPVKAPASIPPAKRRK